MASKLERSARLWNRLAKRYAATPVKHEQDYQKKLEITREYFTPDSEVFEFGCGTGSTAIAHAPHVKHIHATDYSSEMIRIAQEKAETAGISNIDFECIGLDAVEKSDDSVDVVMGHSILHLLRDPQVTIERAYTMLKPGGVFVSSTGCLGDAGIPIRILVWLLRLVRIAPFVKVLSQPELEAMMTDAGFRIVYKWRPGKNKAAFIVAEKPDASAASSDVRAAEDAKPQLRQPEWQAFDAALPALPAGARR